MLEAQAKNILAVDCGSVNTTAILIDQVEGSYRLAATGQTASTHIPPWQDVTRGIVEACRQIEKTMERSLLAPGGWPITPQASSQKGVDLFMAVSSAGMPLQLVLAGLIQEITLNSARRAAATTYTSIAAILDVAAGPETRIQATQKAQPDAILLVGGTDGGATQPVLEMAAVLAMAIQALRNTARPYVLYAGNNDLQDQISSILSPVTTFKTIDNIRPTLELENLAPAQKELENQYINRKMPQLPGFQKLGNWSKYPITAASKSFEKVIGYLGQQQKLNIIGLNLGSRSTIVSTQAGKYHNTTVRSDTGSGYSLAALLQNTPLERFHRWLPFSLEPEELHNMLLNKSLYPTTIPTTYEELVIEQAIAREALRLVIEQARLHWPFHPITRRRDIQWNLVIGTGRTLTQAPHPGYAALTLLDSVRPWGVTSLALDVEGITNMLGAIATVHPLAAVEVAGQDTFLNLGTVLAPLGHGRPGEPAVTVGITTDDETTTEIEVAYGSIELFPLPPHRKAAVTIQPGHRFDIGLGQPGRGAETEIEGGLLGLIIDARGRPLRLPEDELDRQEALQSWLTGLGIKDAITEKNH